MVDDLAWLERAVELSYRCPPAAGAYSVGAILVAADGTELASGYSRETDAQVHAEEAALSKIDPTRADLAGATLYTSLEPCSQRRSRLRTCTELILAQGIGRVVLAWREPDLFVADACGYEMLAVAGVTVVELPELADVARVANAHLAL